MSEFQERVRTPLAVTLVLSAIMFGLGRFTLVLFTAFTGWEPQTWWSANIWGIIPAAPFVVAFLFYALLWILNLFRRD